MQLIGNLGRDPELRKLPSGDSVCNIGVATSERWKDNQGQQQERTTWVDCAFFGKLAEVVAQYLHKGSKVFIEGTPSVRAYVSKENEACASLGCRVFTMKMLDSKPEGEQGQQTGAPAQNGGAARPPLTAKNAGATTRPAQTAGASAGAPVEQQGAPPPGSDFDDEIPF